MIAIRTYINKKLLVAVLARMPWIRLSDRNKLWAEYIGAISKNGDFNVFPGECPFPPVEARLQDGMVSGDYWPGEEKEVEIFTDLTWVKATRRECQIFFKKAERLDIEVVPQIEALQEIKKIVPQFAQSQFTVFG